MIRNTTIIGIDCATKANKLGLAVAQLHDANVVLRCVLTGANAKPSIPEFLNQWIPDEGPVLLALDAPLGWPVGMRLGLAEHSAGEQLTVQPDRMFRRLTDQIVKKKTGKLPLDVGADRIARTAHSALQLLADIRKASGHQIPLEWSQGTPTGVCAIEVYPATTLLGLGLRATKYKEGSTALDAREQIIQTLKRHIVFDLEKEQAVLENTDMLDAVLCVQAGQDFLNQKCFEPPSEQSSLVRQEGWIWFGEPEAADS